MPDTEPLPNEKSGSKPPWRDPVRLAYLANNILSLVGFCLVGVGLVLLATFALFALVSPSINPYFGIVGYVILPGIFILGLVLVPVGMLLKHWRVRRKATTQTGEVVYPRIDLNNPRTRRSILVFAAFSCLVVLPVVGVSSYYGYQWTESTTFCGKLCHSVMEPQDTAHARSPHARVTCADCHIGSGASWFVKSKITGVGQVVAVLEDSCPRPIPNAITNLRPARDTCEQCHWPAQFFGSQYRELVRYTPDGANTQHRVRMLIKTGGPDHLTGRVEGIHMHMIAHGRIEYVATDRDLQDVTWVRHAPPEGPAIVYRSDGKPSSSPPPAGLIRTIDCMDCHNRAAHRFGSPQSIIDLHMSAGQLDVTLPYIKRQAVAALVHPYVSVDDARATIERELTGFYQQQYPQVWSARQAAIRQAITATQSVYDQHFFPRMKENWQTYPDNIGHKESAGCFRCHDGLHVDETGKAIRSNCSICHVFLNPIEGQPRAAAEGQFHHPMDLVLHGNLRCDQCHNGGVLLLCRDCHESGHWLSERGKARFRREGD